MPIIKNINELNERVMFIKMQPNDGPEPGDEEEKEVFSCWAKIRTQNIKDVKSDYDTYYQDTMEIVIRQIQDHKITNDMAMKWNGDRYDIIKINPDNAFKEFMVLLVKKTS